MTGAVTPLGHSAVMPDTHHCTVCGLQKPLTEFGTRRSRAAAGGPARPKSHCRACQGAQALASSRRPEEKVRRAVYAKAYKGTDEGRERWRAGKRRTGRTKAQHLAFVALRSQERQRRQAVAVAERSQARAAAQRERARAAAARLLANPSMSSAAVSARARYNTDIKARLYYNIKRRVRDKARCSLAELALKYGVTSLGGSVLEALVGYSLSTLVAVIERQFRSGMSWDAYKAGRIHVDHRRPLAAFNLSTLASFRAAWALDNLQPLWAADNIAKGARVRHIHTKRWGPRSALPQRVIRTATCPSCVADIKG